YSQVLVGPLIAVAFLGCSRSLRFGRILTIGLVMLFGYMMSATYFAKLIPLYGGFQDRTSLSGLWSLYSAHSAELMRNLTLTALAPASVVVVMALAVTLLALVQMASVGRRIVARLW